jgi:GrpB-like predicted nucleotidyltransferase (UPF0157 family)
VTTGDTRADRVARVTAEHVDVVPYDPDWPESFQREKRHLLGFLPRDIIGRIEHFGSTAVPGLSAKPIVDILVEVTDLEAVKARVVPILEAQGYEYFWRPTFGDDGEPFYAWFIKRNPETGQRTHHITWWRATSPSTGTGSSSATTCESIPMSPTSTGA